MARLTRSIGPATALVSAPQEALGVAQTTLDALADLDDDAFVEVEIKSRARHEPCSPLDT